jgi:hypothetical protein
MTMHAILAFAGAILCAITLFCLGGLGEIELATSVQCYGYFCELQTQQPKSDYVSLMREDERVGLR